MKEPRQEHLRKAKGRMSALKGKSGVINGKQKDSAQEEKYVVSDTMRTNVENQRAHLCCSTTADESDGKNSSKGKSLKGRSPSGKRS